ncbi:flavonol synthase flavanone 3-hydroxylase-like [Chlorella sorokiniana]|uniref:Flavonol synthase flavanone 3-hydroxylase-like n=1 Tax=Chlorella sorokiniana TaxID=3076 RepID=A0A2P6TI75_CHLSO|nr:flavonol synthase flavanone 3-hydroxylase-like [Chlorella sorokiniana]|eukprot:PRW33994.1 flavonol synthase flavanone 3-hydroxylase-like [Chlorella sorokiniana]
MPAGALGAAGAGLTAPAAPAKQLAGVDIPVIDGRGFLARERQGAPPPADLAAAISEAGRTTGSFQLVNHGVNQAVIDRMKKAAAYFFALPKETKLKVKRSKDNPLGYLDDEYTKRIIDLKECFDFNIYHPDRPHIPGLNTPNRWPEGEGEFRAALEAYVSELSLAAFKLLEAFSLGLGLPAHALHPVFGDPEQATHTTLMRLNYYPPAEPQATGLALNEHTDPGFLTILLQDSEVPGLEIQVGDTWYAVPPIPDAFVINFGDIAQILSNDVYRAANHRVVAPKSVRARFSYPVFFNPESEAVCQPLPDFVTPERPAAFRPVPWRAFMQARVAGNIEDLGEEIQTYHYRIKA